MGSVAGVSLASTTSVPRIGVAAAVSAALGVLLAAVWSYEFVDDVVGHGVAELLLGEDAAAGPGVIGALVMATVTGLAGTFTACNVACFASMGPLTAEAATGQQSRGALVVRAAGQLAWLGLGMGAMGALYGAAIAIGDQHVPILSEGTVGGLPTRLAQASVVNVLFGLGLALVAYRYLTGRQLPGGRYGTLALGGLLGLLIVGRPFPMFRTVLADAAADGNLLRASAMMVLVVAGNLMLLAILFLGAMATAGPAIQRFSLRHPRHLMMVGGSLLLVLAVFSVVYWGLRVPSRFGYGWFPEL